MLLTSETKVKPFCSLLSKQGLSLRQLQYQARHGS